MIYQMACHQIWNYLLTTNLYLLLTLESMHLQKCLTNFEFKKVNNLSFKGKLSFNLDPRKEALEMIFIRKLKKGNVSSFVFR